MKNKFFYDLEISKNIKYTKQQISAVLHKEGPALVLAVPGAGKTTVILGRTANLIMNEKVKAENILSITFSKASASDMEDRFNELFGQELGRNLKFSTIHSFAFTIVKAYYRKISKPLNVIEGRNIGISKYTILKKIYKDINGELINDDKLEILINAVGYIKNMMLDKEAICEHGKLMKINNLYDIYINYEEIKKINNYVDFDDMLTKCYEILKENEVTVNWCRNKFKYIQVDEGQDVSKIQYEIIRLLAYPKNNLFIVADDDQSIYSFRGSYPQMLLNFKNAFHKAKIFLMEQNFRSNKNIVWVANKFIKKNTVRHDKNIFTTKDEGNKVKIYNVINNEEQLKLILEEIQSKSDLKDIAILYRNNLSVIPLVDLLSKEKIPFYLKDYNSYFFNHWVTQDIYAFINLSMEPSDIDAFERIYYKINSYINKNLVQNLKVNLREGASVFEYLIDSEQLTEYQQRRIVVLKKEFNSLSKLSPYEAIRYIKINLGYYDYLMDNSESMGYSMDNLEMILSTLENISVGIDNFEEFFHRLSELQLIMDGAKFNKKNNAVTLSTLHSSKGLEFKKVYIIFMLEGIIPTGISIKEEKDGNMHLMEEERRLMYVGMTRAKEELALIVPKYSSSGNGISRFVDEITKFGNGNVVEEINRKNAKQPSINVVSEKENPNAIEVGTEVKHKMFGCGIVEDCKNDLIIIKFAKMGIKQFSLSTCLENKLLFIENPK